MCQGGFWEIYTSFINELSFCCAAFGGRGSCFYSIARASAARTCAFFCHATKEGKNAPKPTVLDSLRALPYGNTSLRGNLFLRSSCSPSGINRTASRISGEASLSGCNLAVPTVLLRVLPALRNLHNPPRPSLSAHRSTVKSDWKSPDFYSACPLPCTPEA